MTAKSVTELMADLNITKSHSRPRISNDNPYSEAQFKTLKYHSTFPERFGSLEDARAFCSAFFSWYNYQHCHSGIAFLAPATVHYGRADQVLQQRQQALDEAYAKTPHRFTKRPPQVQRPPVEVWINPPLPVTTAETPRPQPDQNLDGPSRPLLCLSPFVAESDLP